MAQGEMLEPLPERYAWLAACTAPRSARRGPKCGVDSGRRALADRHPLRELRAAWAAICMAIA
jgi:hypothetical protein